MISDTILISDPVFQLNMFIWAVIDSPDDSPTNPILGRAGYSLDAIGKQLLIPANVSGLDVYRTLTGSDDGSPCHPDVCLRHSDDPVILVVELKSTGFSRRSSNAKQAVKLMVSAFNLSESYADPAEIPGCVAYATIRNDASNLAATLRLLRDELTAQNVGAAPTAAIGIAADESGVALSKLDPSELPEPAAQSLNEPAVVLRRDGENELMPLYIVPWIPGIKGTQDRELQADGYRELTYRLLVEAASTVGRARVPCSLTLDGETLVNGATSGVFAYWRDRDETKQFSRSAIEVVHSVLKDTIAVERKSRYSLVLELCDSATREMASDCLAQARDAHIESAVKEMVDLQPTLFPVEEV